jgi:hypothetical protein
MLVASPASAHRQKRWYWSEPFAAFVIERDALRNTGLHLVASCTGFGERGKPVTDRLRPGFKHFHCRSHPRNHPDVVVAVTLHVLGKLTFKFTDMQCRIAGVRTPCP